MSLSLFKSMVVNNCRQTIASTWQTTVKYQSIGYLIKTRISIPQNMTATLTTKLPCSTASKQQRCPYNEHTHDVLFLNSSVHHRGNSFHSQLEHCQTWKWFHQSACRNLYTCTKKQHSCTFIAPRKNFIIVSIFGNQCNSMLLHLERVNILPWSTMRFSNRIMSAVCEVFLTCQLEKNYNHYVLQYCRQKWWCHSCYQWQTSISETIEKSTWTSQTNCDKNPQS